MGFLRSLFTGSPDPRVEFVSARVLGTGTPAEATPQFSVSADSGVLYGAPTLDDFIYKTGRISRREAMRVPAVKRAYDLITGAGQFILRVYDPAGKEALTFSPSLFPQTEPGIAPSVTWARVIGDLFLFERAWLKVTSLGWHGKPAEARRLDSDSINLQPVYKHYAEGVAKVWPERPGLIRIDSPTTGLLDCSPAVRACIALDRATLNYVDGTPPIDYFTPAEDADPFTDDTEAQDFLDNWEATRRERGTAYVPAALRYNVGGWDPAKLQLREAREFAILEVARLTGIDAEDLSVSTTSRTYFNATDRKRHRLEDVLGPYMSAIEGRLSMDDVTPRGYTVRFDTSSFLRADDLTNAQTDSVLVAAKIITPDEARAKRNLEPLGAPDQPDPAAIAQAHDINQATTPAALPAAPQEAPRG